jgi:spermidine synthase
MASRPKRSGALLALVLVLFLASGFSALLYQTIWQRLLGFFSGVDVYSVTITVAAFMAGLGCGSLVGGQLADRLSARYRLLAFALAEGIIALFALASKWLYYDLLYVRWSGLADSALVLPVVLFVSLLLPTFCMGVTLPILAKAFTGKIETAPSVVGYLYGVNTLGAAFGALASPWILFRYFAFPDILKIGAALNAFCAAGACLVWFWVGRDRPAAPEQVSERGSSTAVEPSRLSLRNWMLIYALSGFIALALEIVWFRLLGVFQKSTAFTFPTLLAVYLGGLAAGVIIGVPLTKRVRRPALAFLALQSGVTLYAAIAITSFLHHVDRLTFLESIWWYLGSYEPLHAGDVLPAITAWFSGAPITPELGVNFRFGVLLHFVLPFVLIAPSTLLMGMSFPVLQKAVQDNPLLLGRRVGWLQTLNIAGSMLGALLVGWCLLRWLGTAGTLKLLVLVGGVFPCLVAWHVTRRRRNRVAALALSIVIVGWLAFIIPPAERLWAKMHGTVPGAIIAREDGSGLAVVKGDPDDFTKETVWVFSNGIGQSWLPYGLGHTRIGLVAVALHPKPVEVAVIGLGSGDTVYALGGSPHTQQITCIEIVKANRAVLVDVARRVHYPALDALLQDSRIRWEFTDGRAYVSRSSKQFDVIEADALRPTSAYSGNLYSLEYFRTLNTRLKPDGLAVTWAPTDRVLASFLEVFPYVIVVNTIAIGSQQPIDTDPAGILGRLSDPFTTQHYERIQSDLRPLIEDLVTGKFTRFSPKTKRPPNPDLNSDLFPKDEYLAPRL